MCGECDIEYFNVIVNPLKCIILYVYTLSYMFTDTPIQI